MDILLELHILAALREVDGEDETRYMAGQDSILSHYQITRDQFQRSHDYYHRNMEEQQQRYATVRMRLEELSAELSDRYFRIREAEKAEEFEKAEEAEGAGEAGEAAEVGEAEKAESEVPEGEP